MTKKSQTIKVFRGRLALDYYWICLQSLKLELLQLHFCFHPHSVPCSVYNCHLFPEMTPRFLGLELKLSNEKGNLF